MIFLIFDFKVFVLISVLHSISDFFILSIHQSASLISVLILILILILRIESQLKLFRL